MKNCFEIKKMDLFYGNFHALKNIDMDNITPREAYAQLEEFKKMLE